jgi:hypothetical protein
VRPNSKMNSPRKRKMFTLRFFSWSKKKRS